MSKSNRKRRTGAVRSQIPDQENGVRAALCHVPQVALPTRREHRVSFSLDFTLAPTLGDTFKLARLG